MKYENLQIAKEFKYSLDTFNTDGYIRYVLERVHNRFGNKYVCAKDDIYPFFKKIDPSFRKRASKIKSYESLLEKGHTPKEIADALGLGILKSVVLGTIECSSDELSDFAEDGLLEWLGYKRIIIGDKEVYEPLYSASSFFEYVKGE